MKWWWILGILTIGGMMFVNEAWYGNSAAFGMAISMIVVTLIGMENLDQRHRIRRGGLISVLIAGAIYFGLPSYSVLDAELELKNQHENVKYLNDVGVVNEGWNPFQPNRAYLFEIDSGDYVLFLPDSGDIIKTRPLM
ncbi:hypothetical protein [Exiguobacterium sp. SH3S1]|uniref:hypothetical protein n=1 Tax=Exiguobacterium sp. SH3S1 TaxID=2510955 RepID=UPI001039227C|nr:hypothetical protein [Exiguobacterium sp. SH3S1]TCI60338.1 hypothetical protein EVJ26_11215 [Exiguobacterium sp. SH3S1]